MKEKKFSVIKHIDGIKKRENSRKPAQKRQIVQQEEDLPSSTAGATPHHHLLVVPRNNPFEPFGESHAQLVSALKNFYTDSCAALSSVIRTSIDHVREYLEPAERAREWLSSSPNTRFHSRKVESMANLRMPSPEILAAGQHICAVWEEVQTAALSTIIYKTTPPRAPSAPPAVVVTWSAEPAGSDGEKALMAVWKLFSHVSALLVECQRQMDTMNKIISRFFEQPRATFRIKIL